VGKRRRKEIKAAKARVEDAARGARADGDEPVDDEPDGTMDDGAPDSGR
jgi:hypothetical protein